MRLWFGVFCWLTMLLLGGCQAPAPTTRIFVASSAHAFVQHTFPNASIISGPSHVLRTQLEHGARADLFISAHPEHTQALSTHKLWSAPVGVMRTQVVAVASAARGEFTHIDDLPRAERLVLAHPNVPLGRYTQALLAQRGEAQARRTWERARSLETQAAHVRLKLSTGAASASVIYKSELRTLSGWRVLASPRPVYARYVAVTHGPLGERLLARLTAQDPTAWGFESPRSAP